jgi:hypothetical protein
MAEWLAYSSVVSTDYLTACLAAARMACLWDKHSADLWVFPMVVELDTQAVDWKADMWAERMAVVRGFRWVGWKAVRWVPYSAHPQAVRWVDSKVCLLVVNLVGQMATLLAVC